MKSNLILFLVVGLFWGCQTKNDDKAQLTNQNTKVKIINTKPKSLNEKDIAAFHFTAKTHKDSIDSKTGTYTRFYIAGSKSVHFELTPKEQSVIQSIYFDSKLDTLSDNFLPKSMLWRNNLNYDVDFAIYFNGNKKNLFVKDHYNPYYGRTDENTKKIIDNMDCFYGIVYRFVCSKKEVKKLKVSDL